MDNLFENSFEHAAIGMALVAPNGRWLKVNNSLCQMFDFSEAELLETNFQNLTHPDDLNSGLVILEEMLSNKCNNHKMDKRYIKKDGSIVWASLNVSLIRDNHGQPDFFIAQIQDITEAKEQQQLLRMLVSDQLDGYWDWHINKNYQYTSPRFWEILGYDPEEMQHTPEEWQKCIFEEDLEKINQNLSKHIHSKGLYPFNQEVRYRHKDGSTAWFICKGNVTDWSLMGEPLRMIGTHTDITAFKEAKQELQKQKELQNHHSRLISLGQLSGSIAHEINNPLAILSGNADMLKMQLRKETINKDAIKKSAQYIKDTVQRIDTIVTGLKSFSRDGSSDDRESFAVHDLVDEVLGLCKDRCNRDIIDLKVHGEENLVVHAQKTQLGQVLINLLNNSLDAIKDFEKQWVSISFIKENEFARIEVTDCGKGLPQEVRNNIMKPFFTTKKRGEGTGIGLSLCKSIIEKHYGESFYDDQSPNTKFVIKVPLDVQYVAS